MTTPRKLWLGFGSLIALLVLICAAILLRVRSIEASVEEQSLIARPRDAITRELEIHVVGYALAVRGYAQNDNPAFRDRAQRLAAAVDRELAEYQRLAATERQRELAGRFASMWQELRNANEKVLASKVRPLDPAESDRLAQMRSDVETFLEEEMQTDALASYEERREATFGDIRAIIGFSIILLLLAIVAAIATSGSVTRAVLRGERDLAEQGERLRTTLASIGDAVITTDAEGLITNLNSVAEEMTGWKSAEAAGKPLPEVFRIVNEESRATVENPATRALRDGVVVGLANHTVLIAKDGTERPIDDSAAPIRCKMGEIVGCVLVFRDVTERRRADRKLRESEERLRLAQQVARIGTFEWNIQTGVNRWTPELEAMYGLAPGGFNGTQAMWESLVHPDDFQRAVARVGEAMEHGHYSDEWRVVWPDGSTHWLAGRGWVFKDAEGKPLRLIGVNIDITDRKQADEELRRSEASYRAIGEAIDFGVWMCDAQGRNTYASESFLRLVGMTQQQCSEFGWGDVLHPDDAEATIAAWKETVRTGGVWDREHRFQGVDGQWHYVLARGVPIENDEGEVTHWVGINLDIGRMKQAELLLQEADRRKDEFLATLAHELRNPLAPVRNAVQVLQMMGSEVPELRWSCDVIDRQMQAMTRLIDDLMDVSRISRNKLELRRERVALAHIVQGAIETSRSLIEQQQHELSVTLPPEPIVLEADLTRLAQVFLNLLNNAAKYTEPGGKIDLRAERQGSDVVVSVRDTGIGIPSAHLPHLFTMFSQLEGSLNRSQGGLGIGLALVKRLVEMHGGSIEARSDGPGRGSEFSVRLPIVVEDAYAWRKTHPVERVELHSRLRILVVDDNKDSASSLAMLLRIMGNNVRTAHDGAEAVTAAAEFQPRVALLDIGMPKMNGYEAARAIRATAWGKNMVLVAVTGWGQDDDRRNSEAAGFDRHMVKPVDPQALMRLLAGLSEAAPVERTEGGGRRAEEE